jgi:hypothetical protein
VTPRLLALIKAESHLIERLGKIEPHLGDDSACWHEYATIASALAAIAPALRPEALAEVLTQGELAERIGVSERTIRRRVKARILPSKRRAW